MEHLARRICRYVVISLIVSLSCGCASRSRITSDFERPIDSSARTDENRKQKIEIPPAIDLTQKEDPVIPVKPIIVVTPDEDPGKKITNVTSKSDVFEVIYFGLDEHTIAGPERDKLSRTFSQMRTKKGAEFILEGHCDERGSDVYNIALGEKRAQAVKLYLVTLGMPEAKLGAMSFGKEKPVDPGHNEASWAKNRRVEIRQR